MQQGSKSGEGSQEPSIEEMRLMHERLGKMIAKQEGELGPKAENFGATVKEKGDRPEAADIIQKTRNKFDGLLVRMLYGGTAAVGGGMLGVGVVESASQLESAPMGQFHRTFASDVDPSTWNQGQELMTQGVSAALIGLAAGGVYELYRRSKPNKTI